MTTSTLHSTSGSSAAPDRAGRVRPDDRRRSACCSRSTTSDLIDARDYLRYWPAGLVARRAAEDLSRARATAMAGSAGCSSSCVGTWMLLERHPLLHGRPARAPAVGPGGLRRLHGVAGLRRRSGAQRAVGRPVAVQRARDHGRRRAAQQLAGVPGRRPDRGHGRMRDRSAAGVDRAREPRRSSTCSRSGAGSRSRCRRTGRS